MVLFTSLRLAPELFVPIAVIAYLYLGFAYGGYPYLIRAMVPKKLLAIKHKLQKGSESIIGTVTKTGKPTIVLDTEADIIGINNRNLDDFTVDIRTTERLMEICRQREPAGSRIIVSESGVRTEADADFLADTGVDAVLVGEALMRSGDPSGLIRAFRKKRSVRAA
jgi:indole-3-glycerol phosphate synthase